MKQETGRAVEDKDKITYLTFQTIYTQKAEYVYTAQSRTSINSTTNSDAPGRRASQSPIRHVNII